MELELEELRSQGALGLGEEVGAASKPLHQPMLGDSVPYDVPLWLCGGAPVGTRPPRVISQQSCPKASMVRSIAAGTPLLSPGSRHVLGSSDTA